MLFSRPLQVAAVLFAVSFPCLAAHAETPASAKKAIQAVYNKADASVGKRDMAGLESTSTPDYAVVLKNGKKLTLDQLRPQMQQMFQRTIKMSAKTVIEKVSLKGKEAEVTAKTHNEVFILNPQTQKPSQYVIDSTVQDIWVKSAKGWLKKQTKSLSQTAKIDGKPAPTM